MSDVAISQANLSGIESELSRLEHQMRAVTNGIDILQGDVRTINGNIEVVYSQVDALARDFHDYVKKAESQHNLSIAETRLIKIRQELETKYGHYATVRRTTTGIMQADDIEIVRTETISSVSEELMITTPNYWLTPCLVALAAWINNQPEIADRAVREAIKRNDEKTSLLFALICRRSGRKDASLKWVHRYLAAQDPENLDRKSVIIIDAFASGLLGADSEGVISKHLTDWMDKLSEAPGFVERQRSQWSEAIQQKRRPARLSEYVYLPKYSPTWPQLQYIMEGACLHATFLQYLTNIFEQQISSSNLKQQLDQLLDSLVSDFDDEELPLRKEEKLNQFIVDYNGDLDRANADMTVEQTAFETNKDFTQMLTDAAMRPESSHAGVAIQKFAVALSRDWVLDAYNDVVAQNRIKIPTNIEISIDSYNSATQDGRDEQAHVSRIKEQVAAEKAKALAANVLTAFEQFCLYGGIALGGLGIGLLFINVFLGAVLIIAGIGLILNHFSKKKNIVKQQDVIEKHFAEKETVCIQILQALLAEVVDFRAAFASKDAESVQVVDFISQITPSQYINKAADSNRRIKLNA